MFPGSPGTTLWFQGSFYRTKHSWAQLTLSFTTMIISSMAKGFLFLLTAFMIFLIGGGTNPRCLNSIEEVEKELSSIVPPIDGWFTNNYRNISRALFPGFNLPSLYTKVTIQFVNDTANQTAKTISDKKPMKFTWSESCTVVYTKFVGLTAMSVYSLGTVLPQRRQTELVLTVPPLCKNAASNNNFNDDNEMWQYVLLTVLINIMYFLPLTLAFC